MGHKFAEIGFTDTVKALQKAYGSRTNYTRFETREDYNVELTERETDFIAERDSFYMASVSETGWPYVQHRGGPSGFMKLLDSRTLGFADYSGNRQYMSTGNFKTDDRVSLFFMDYPNRRRLKMFGRVTIINLDQESILAKLEDSAYPAQIERAFLIHVDGFDWNCPAHITPRYTQAQVDKLLSTLHAENAELRRQHISNTATPHATPVDAEVGDGTLPLVVSGIRQLTPSVRSYLLNRSDGGPLPEVKAGAHLRLPIRMPNGELTERYYSIASDPRQREAFEIAVLHDSNGSGASIALHNSYHLGLRLNVDPPENHFGLHTDQRSAVLLAGGIGITPLRAMSYELQHRNVPFELHHASASREHIAFREESSLRLGRLFSAYAAADGDRLNFAVVLNSAPADALFYACGPQGFITGLFEAAKHAGVSRDRIRVEPFS